MRILNPFLFFHLKDVKFNGVVIVGLVEALINRLKVVVNVESRFVTAIDV